MRCGARRLVKCYSTIYCLNSEDTMNDDLFNIFFSNGFY